MLAYLIMAPERGKEASRIYDRRTAAQIGTIGTGSQTVDEEVGNMALYEYKCSDCEERFELMRSVSAADEPARCTQCGGTESRRLISSFASITPGAAATSSSTATMPLRKVGHGCGGGGCCG